MTWEELGKVPFRFVSHIAMADEHVSNYSSRGGKLGFSVITKVKDDFDFGRSRRHWRIGDEIYKSKAKFMEALKEFNPDNLDEV